MLNSSSISRRIAPPQDMLNQVQHDDLGERKGYGALAPTTGTTAAWLARALFPDAEVHLTGLSYVDDPSPERWDYQSGATGRIGPEHRVAAEGALLRRWWQEGRVRFWPTDSEEEA